MLFAKMPAVSSSAVVFKRWFFTKQLSKKLSEMASSAFNWGYSPENGPEIWPQHFPAGRGAHQSPIDIVPDKVKYDPNLNHNRLHIDYRDDITRSLRNSGKTVLVKLYPDASSITGGPLGDSIYRPVQFHFHWGCTGDHGSEHRLNGKTYPMELHIVHQNMTKYPKFSDALENHDGLAVIGVFIEMGHSNPSLQSLTEHFDVITFSGTKLLTPGYNIKWLLPPNLADYFTYQGSLTTPPLNECVTWILFKQTIPVSVTGLAKFQRLLNHMKTEVPVSPTRAQLADNVRPVQPLNDRLVRSSFNWAHELSANANFGSEF